MSGSIAAAGSDARPPALGDAPPDPGVGDRLRGERERRGLSLAAAAKSLNLQPETIEAFEAERFEQVGPPVYARGHLRQYATLLDLPSAELVAGYDRWRASQQAGAVPCNVPAPTSRAGARRRAAAARILQSQGLAGGAVAVLVFAVVVANIIAREPWRGALGANRPAAEKSQDSLETDAGDEGGASANAPARIDAEPSRVLTSVAAADRALTEKAVGVETPPPSRARLRLSFTQDCWVEVRDAHGAMLLLGRQAANSTRVVAGAAPLSVYLGFASGVQMEINGRTIAIEPRLVRGDVARFEAGADGNLRRSVRSASLAR